MSDPVFLVPGPALAEATTGADLRVSGPEARHAVTVMRLTPGQSLDLVDGRGRRVHGSVLTAQPPDRLVVRVSEVLDEPHAGPAIMVVQALPKGEHGELAVDLMTQAGVDVLVPWAARHSVAVWRGEKAERGRAKWQAAAERAAKQARRATVPDVRPLAGLDQVLEAVRGADAAFVLHEEAGASLAGAAIPAEGTLVLVVGPEGGIDPAERAQLAAAGAVEAGLGPTVLRSSFAGAAAVVAVCSRTRWLPWEDGQRD